MTTFKLVLNEGTTKEQLYDLLKKRAEFFEIVNFYANQQIGRNKVSYAMVDLPQECIFNLSKDKIIKNIERIESSGMRPSDSEDCGGGGCCTPKG